MLTDNRSTLSPIFIQEEYSEPLETDTGAKTAHYFVSTTLPYTYYQYLSSCTVNGKHIIGCMSLVQLNLKTKVKGWTTSI